MLNLCGGGGCATSRGSLIELYGNEAASTGNIDIESGAVSNSQVRLIGTQADSDLIVIIGGATKLAVSSDDTDFRNNVIFGTGGSLELPNGTTLPATCSVGNVFHDTDSDDCADTGSGDGALCICKSTDTWALVSNF